MVDICPFKAQERMNDVCKNNYFSPRTKQSYTKLSKLEKYKQEGRPVFRSSLTIQFLYFYINLQ